MAILIIFISIAFLFPARILSFLRFNRELSSEILVIESWIPDYALNNVVDIINSKDYNQIIIIGNPYTKELTLSENGYLVFDLSQQVIKFSDDSLHQIKINMFGSSVKRTNAHFKILVNGYQIGDGFTKNRPTDYYFSCTIKPIKEISVLFDNDFIYKSHDRNLYISSLFVDNTEIHLYNNNVIYNLVQPSYQIKSRKFQKTPADELCNKLIDFGVPDSIMVSLTSYNKYKSKTYTNALDVLKYLQDNHPYTKSINIYTMDIHSRRSWLSYKRAFGEKYQIGVINFTNNEFGKDNWWKSWIGIKYVSAEVFALVLAFLFL
ncbi:MAG: hypothetical protein JXJ22_10180 [Bacteroidales bacterium]|nr:hypothetical protein [Bacteroidales bacterium]